MCLFFTENLSILSEKKLIKVEVIELKDEPKMKLKETLIERPIKILSPIVIKMQEKEIIMNEKLAHNNTDELKDKMEENLIKHQIANNKTIEPVVDEARRESKENANIIPTRRNSSATETQKILKRIAKSPTKKYKGTKVNIVKNLEKPIQPPRG